MDLPLSFIMDSPYDALGVFQDYLNSIISLDCEVEFPKFFFFMTNKKPTPMYVLAKELDPTACCIPKVGIAMKASILEVSALRAPAGVVAYGVGEAGVALFYHLSSALSLWAII